MMEMDLEHWGRPDWNPMGKLVEPGNVVLIKPNLVKESNYIKESGTDCLYTHPSVVAAVIDYVVIALRGNGQIIVGDAPIQECKWDTFINESGYGQLIEWYRKHDIKIELVDFRELTSEVKNGIYVQSLNSDAKGKVIDLGRDSDFSKIPSKNYERIRITNYNPNFLLEHHGSDKHEYYVSNYMLKADVLINVPKPKTHRKAGITGALKNLVGINIRKEYLPHHTMGAVDEGGDEYDKKNWIHSIRSKIWDRLNIASSNEKYMLAYVYKCVSRLLTFVLIIKGNKYSEGSWYGNRTINHTIVDLNKIVLYADKSGTMREIPQRKIFIVGDMIISGEKDGPTAPSPKRTGVIVIGDDQLCFDEAISAVMGFDRNKIPTLTSARQLTGKYKLTKYQDNVQLCSNIEVFNDKAIDQISYEESFQFQASPGWRGHIELV